MKISQTERASRKCISTFWKYFKIVVISTLIPLIIYWSWMLVRMLLFDYFTVPSESMCPTLMPGDKVIVNKLILVNDLVECFFYYENYYTIKWKKNAARCCLTGNAGMWLHRCNKQCYRHNVCEWQKSIRSSCCEIFL